MSMGKQSRRLTLVELRQLKWLLGGVLSLLALWSLSSLDFAGSGVLLLASLVVVWSLVFPAACARLPKWLWRLGGPLILCVVAVDFVVNLSNFLPALIRMVLWLLLYRSLAQRRVREDLQLVLLCLFSLVISGALTVSMVFAVQILLFAPLAMVVMFVFCLLDESEVPDGVVLWAGFGWRRLLPRVWQVMDLRVWGAAGALFACMVVVSTVLFMLMPRFNLDQAIPFLDIPGEARSGFSDDVSLTDVSTIREDNSVALRVDVPSLEAVGSMPYWRMLVLDQYEGGRWQLSDSAKALKRRWTTAVVPSSESLNSGRSGDAWTLYLEGGISQYLPVPGAFGRMRFQGQQEVANLPALGVYGLDQVKQSVFAYQLDGLDWRHRFTAAEQEREVFAQEFAEAAVVAGGQDGAYPFTLTALALSEVERGYLTSVNEALGLAGGGVRAAEYSEQLTSYLRERYQYSLSPSMSASEGDPVVGWLRDGDRGHCELFAASFILLAREAGYPARMAIGFAGGSWNSVEAYYVVRNKQAHAWVEIYDRQSHTWLRVDPTPGSGPSNPEIAERGAVQIETGWSAWMDSLRIQWYRRIVNFDQDDQIEIALAIRELVREWGALLSERIDAVKAALVALLVRPFSGGSLLVAGLLLVCGGFVWWFWRLRDWIGRGFWGRSRRGVFLSPMRLQAQRQLKRVEARLVIAEGEHLQVLQALRRELQQVRFGPEVSLAESRAVFRRVRQGLRE